jgi:iron complex transport system substrate-binding protein
LSHLRTLGIVTVTAVALSLSACAPAAENDAAAASDGSFPVTIDHVFGTTTIESQPKRVATVAWSNHEVALALGVVPVGMGKVTWGDDDDNGVLPWVEDKLEELGAETPVLFDETDGIDFEAVADTAPDVILAAYSGLTQEEYDTLSKIAPVVAYPEVAWGTSLDEMILMNSKALGLEAEGEQLVTDLETEIDAALETHSEFADKKVLFAFVDPTDFSQVGFYTSHDTRPGFLADHGMPMPTLVEEESAGTEEFYVSVSAEQAARFADVDVFVTYGEADGVLVSQMQADPLLSQIPAVANGAIVILENGSPLAASANPSPLSIGWGVDEYFGLLASAIQPAG